MSSEGLERTREFHCVDFEVWRTCWDPRRHPSQRMSVAPCTAIELMRHGSYVRTRAGEQVVGDASNAVLFEAGERFQASHTALAPNCGTTIRLTVSGVEQVRRLQRARGSDGSPFAGRRAQTLTPGARLDHARLVQLLRAGGTALEVQDVVISLLDGVLEGPVRDRTGPAAFRIARAREYMAASLSRNIRLSDIAAVVGCSTWTLSREFRLFTGTALHRHLFGLRVSFALHMIAQGERNLARVALASGFCSHSHMSAWFRRDLGTSPRAVKCGGARSKPA